MTLQAIYMMTEFRPEEDGTVTTRFTVSGLREDQAEGVAEKIAVALKNMLVEYTKDGHVEMIRPGVKLQ